jgi:hypothetical protein
MRTRRLQEETTANAMIVHPMEAAIVAMAAETATVVVVGDATAVTETDAAKEIVVDVATTITAIAAGADTATGLTSATARGERVGAEAEAQDHPPVEGMEIPVVVAIAGTDLLFLLSL